MAPPNNPEVCRVSIIMARDNRQEVNTMHFQKSAWSGGDLVTLCSAIRTWWDTYYKPTVGSWVTLVQVSARVYNPAAPLAYDLGVTPPIAGTRAGGELPGNVTNTISWRTGLAGRKYRGRIYHAGPVGSDVTFQDLLTSGFITLLGVMANHLLTDIFAAIGANPVVFHRATNTFTSILGFVVENILDSQRRRLPGRGR